MTLPKFQCTKCEQPFSGGPPWICLSCDAHFDHLYLLKITATDTDKAGNPIEVLTIELINERYQWTHEGKVLIKKQDKIKASILALSVMAMQNRMDEVNAMMGVIRDVFKEEYGDDDNLVGKLKQASGPDSGLED